jgi:hypothetical protein
MLECCPRAEGKPNRGVRFQCPLNAIQPHIGNVPHDNSATLCRWPLVNNPHRTFIGLEGYEYRRSSLDQTPLVEMGIS